MSKRSYIELVRAITCTFMHGFQNNFAQLLSLKNKVPSETIFFRKVEGQGHRGQIKVKMVINCAAPGHNLYIYALISK